MTNISGKKCLLDTNILVAYLNKHHRFHQQAEKIFEKIFAKEFIPYLSSQNIFELSAVLIHAYKIPRSQVARDINILCSDPLIKIIFPGIITLNYYCELLKKSFTLHAGDLFLLSTAKEHGIEVIITADKNFQKIKGVGLDFHNPFL